MARIAVMPPALQLHRAGALVAAQIVTGRWQQNCYVLKDEQTGAGVIVDPGDDAAAIIDAVVHTATRVEQVWLTHGHYDHLGAAREICAHFAIAVRLHAADAALARRAPLYAARFDQRRIQLPEQIEAFNVDEPVRCGGVEMSIWPSPGHTPGSVCFFSAELAVCGDLLHHNRLGRADLPESNRDLLQASAAALLSRLPDVALILPGHGPVFGVQAARRVLAQAQPGQEPAVGR